MTMTVEVFSIFFLCAYYKGSHRTCSVKKMFLIISHNSQENTCVTDSNTCFPLNIAKFWRTLTLRNICERLVLLPKPWLYCFLALYSFKLTKHSHFLIFKTLHANSATKIKEHGDISYNSNVTTIWK